MSGGVKMHTGDLIRKYRKNKRLTQKQLAERVHLTSQVISNIERNYTAASTDDLINIANALDVTPNQLLGAEDKITPSLSKKETKDIAIEVQNMLDGMNTDAEINFYGEPMSEEDKELLAAALETALQVSKRAAKKKFTRNDYKKKSGD